MQEDAIIDLLLRKTLRAQRRSTVSGAGPRSQTATSAVPWPEMEDTPLNEFKTQGRCTLCFAALFPYGRGDPTNVARRQKVTNADGFKHPLRYYDVDESGGRYWLATHPRFPHWAQNMRERHRLLSQASVFVKRHEGDAVLTVHDLKAMLLCKTIAPAPSHIDTLCHRLPGSSAETFAALLSCLRAPVDSTCAMALFGGILPLTKNFRHAGTTSPSKSVDLAASLATSFVSSSELDGALMSPPNLAASPVFSSSGFDGSSRLSSSGSSGTSCVFSSGSRGVFCISCLRYDDVGCCSSSSSSSCTLSCRAPIIPADSSSPGFNSRFQSSAPILPVLSSPSIHCTACRFVFTCKHPS